MIPLIINILAFAAVFLTVFAVNAVLTDFSLNDRRRVRKRMEENFRQRQVRKARDETKRLEDFGKIAAEARSECSTRTLGQRLQDLVDQSGLDVTVSRVMWIAIGLSVPFSLFGILGLGLLFGPWVGILGFVLPWLYVAHKRRQRINKLREQLPDAFELMSRVMRAGQTVSQAMQAVSEEFSRPISLEFLYCSEQMNLGLSAETALRDLAQRTGLLEIKIFVLAVVVHRQTGGNLAELLDKLAHVVRERFRIAGMIQSLTAQGRFQALILLSLPPAMFVLLMAINPTYEAMLLKYPLMIVVAVVLMGAGALWINRIVNFDY